VLGRVPLMQCYMCGNQHPTLPNSFGDCDGAKADTSRGRGNRSRLCELKVTVAEAGQRRKELTSEQRRKAVETMKRRRAEREEPGRMEAESGDD
jgi:hypothetical protein